MKKTLKKIIQKARRTETVVFSEKPAEVEETSPRKKDKDLSASALFSLFTANIIKEEKIFTR